MVYIPVIPEAALKCLNWIEIDQEGLDDSTIEALQSCHFSHSSLHDSVTSVEEEALDPHRRGRMESSSRALSSAQLDCRDGIKEPTTSKVTRVQAEPPVPYLALRDDDGEKSPSSQKTSSPARSHHSSNYSTSSNGSSVSSEGAAEALQHPIKPAATPRPSHQKQDSSASLLLAPPPHARLDIAGLSSSHKRQRSVASSLRAQGVRRSISKRACSLGHFSTSKSATAPDSSLASVYGSIIAQPMQQERRVGMVPYNAPPSCPDKMNKSGSSRDTELHRRCEAVGEKATLSASVREAETAAEQEPKAVGHWGLVGSVWKRGNKLGRGGSDIRQEGVLCVS